MKKRLVALLLSGVLAVSALTGCGNTDKTESTQTQEVSGYVYVPEYFDWGFEVGENDWINTNGVINGYVTGMYQSYDEINYKQKQELLCMNLEDGSVTRIPIALEKDNQSVNFFTMKEDGTVIACVEEYNWDENSQTSNSTYTLLYLDQEGNTLKTVDFTPVYKEMAAKDEWNRPRSMALDAEGALFVQFEQQIVAVDEDGKKQFVVESSDWINNMGSMPDGSVYITYYGQRGQVLAIVDKAAQKLGDSYDISGNFNGFFQINADNIMYYNDSSSMRKLDLATGESEVVFKWLDCDIIGNYINGVACENEDTVFAYYSNWESGEESFIKLTKTERNQVAEKQIITIAALEANNEEMESKIVAFNKANDEYRMELTTYLDYANMSEADYANYDKFIDDAVTRMKNDLTGKNPPDIICLSSGYIDARDLAKQGLIEELTPYLEKAGYSEDDFVAGVVNANKIDGKLYTLPARFSLVTAIANSAYVGDRQGWTLEEVLEVVKNLPEGVELTGSTTQSGFVSECLMFGYDTFIDSDNAQCHFDSPEFKALLEVAKTFPKEYNYKDDAPSEPALMSAGEIAMIVHSMSELNDIQMCLAFLGDQEGAFIGLPGAVGNGSLIAPYGANYTICTKSDQKDVAAKFIIDSLTEDYNKNKRFSWGFPSFEKAFDDYIADELDVAYLKDDKGELILDEEGNPIPEGGSSAVGWGDWEYSYRPATQEEADILRELVNGAVGSYSYNTELFGIIMEELEPFFNNQQSADQVAKVIQNRISLYLTENS